MTFAESVGTELEGLRLLNQVLVDIGTKRLDENEYFSMGEFSGERYVKATLQKHGCAAIQLEISKSGIEIGIENVAEAVEFGTREVSSRPHIVTTLITNLLTSKILVETFGSFKAVVTVLGEGSSILHVLTQYWGMWPSKRTSLKLFDPAFRNVK